MKHLFFWFCSTLFVNALTVFTAPQDVVKVSLYYESLCPYCRDFVKNQLYPTYLKIQQAGLIIDLIPYGKSKQIKENGKWKFTCQHGVEECFGNKVQACALSETVGNKIGFVGCLMGSNNPASVGMAQKCASRNNISWTSLSQCFSTTEGDDLLAHYGARTQALNPKLPYVPHILFNGFFNETVEDLARYNFLEVVCSLFDSKPDGCETD